MQQKIQKTIENLKKNNIRTHFLNSKDELIPLIEQLVPAGASVAVGGSMSLFETGVIEHLRSGRYNFYDRYADGLTPKGVREVYIQSLSADAYFCSSNAVTEEGELYNVDGNANRVAAISFGPKKVILVVGVNKIVQNLEEAVKRVKTVAAPKNCKRLNCHTYCFEKGVCVEEGLGKGCQSKERICRHYVVTSKQKEADRIHVILINETLGY